MLKKMLRNRRVIVWAIVISMVLAMVVPLLIGVA